MNTRVLLWGNDSKHIKYRALVLSTAGFTVKPVLGLTGLQSASSDQIPAVAILCHSLNPVEQRQASAASKDLAGCSGSPADALAANRHYAGGRHLRCV